MKNKFIDIILLFSIGVIWGIQFIFIDFSLEAYTPIQLAFFRTFYAAIFLIIFCCILKKNKFQRSLKSCYKVLLIALLEVIVPFNSIMWGQKYISGSMSSILMGTIPLFTMILVMITGLEKINKARFLGVVIGFLGLLALFLPSFSIVSFSGSMLPKLAILLGALSFSLALLIIKSMPNEDPYILSRDAFIAGTIIMFTMNFHSIHFYNGLNYLSVPFLSALFLGVLCSGVVYVLYVTLIKRAGASFCSLSNYLVPLFGSVFGILITHDHVSSSMFFACTLILISFSIEYIYVHIVNFKNKFLLY
jgi:drug/metabolite transporter (DMT)-like permease